ncbi:hypothetical protein TNCV_4704661 [Trichonephila clavipes]|nr:hypothetical protein TNCV_4704661 [Trichonephila clavipes]
MVSLFVWKEVSGVESTSDVVGAEVLIADSRSFVFLGRPDPPRSLPSLLPTPSIFRSDRGGGVRPILGGQKGCRLQLHIDAFVWVSGAN